MSLFDLPPSAPDPQGGKRPAKGASGAPRSGAPRSRAKAQDRTGSASDSRPESRTGARPDSPAGSEARAILGVGELTGRIAGQLAGMGRIAVEGEVSALKRAGSGHLYFSLKDDRASLSCAIWRSKVPAAVRFDLRDGQQVVCHGKLDVYAPRGNYSLIVERVEPRGLGEMLARLERLKKELAAQGWFDRKRPLPAQPRRIGLVTSRDADALRDFLRTRSLRWPGYPVTLCHTRVQGPGAAQEIARAIARLDDGSVDVICVVRGGGSIEDLWAFNERPVAEAVFQCSVPVISGVGHETDTTLIDFVSDHRAHTPTNAAEQAIPDRAAWLDRLERVGAYLESAMGRHLALRGQALERLAARPSLRSADGFLSRPLERLASHEHRLQAGMETSLGRRQTRLDAVHLRLSQASPEARLTGLQSRIDALGPRLTQAMQTRWQRAQSRLDAQARVLHAISPLSVLGRGYALVERLDEHDREAGVVRDAESLRPGEGLRVTLQHGRAIARVERTETSGGSGISGGSGNSENSDAQPSNPGSSPPEDPEAQP